MVTSQLILNGGALVALLGVDELRPALLAGPAWWFIAGLGFALIGGVASASLMLSQAINLNELLWADDPFRHATYNALYESIRPPRAFTMAAAALLAMSAVAFGWGCLKTAEMAQEMSLTGERRSLEKPSARPEAAAPSAVGREQAKPGTRSGKEQR
ncbi:MAG TPA: hypothetical protein VHM92_06495 [Allosphingosinicella sp.]|nr:hypothetical protein [Allosphingosinicella sp.]